MQKIVFDFYPNPVGVDAVWRRSTGGGIGVFANQVKFERNNSGLNVNPVKGTPVVQYYYSAAFHDYLCSGSNEIMSDWKGEASAGIHIAANSLEGYLGEIGDNMTVDERPVKAKQPVKEMWKGHELLHPYGWRCQVCFNSS